MSITCSICLVSSTGNDDDHFSCIPCGHVFHINCIDQWLKTKRACPECRHCCNPSNVLKLFLKHDGSDISISEEPTDQEASETVRKYRNKIQMQQQQLESLRLELSEKEKAVDAGQKLILNHETVIKDLRAYSKDLKKEQSSLLSKLLELNALKEHSRNLEERVSMLARIKTCVEGSFLDVQQLLLSIQGERDTSQGRETLMVCVESLRREMETIKTTNNRLLQDTRRWQQKEAKYALDFDASKKEIQSLQEKLQDAEENYKMVSNKLISLEKIIVSKPDLPQTQIKRFIHENPAPEGLFGTPVSPSVAPLSVLSPCSPDPCENNKPKKLKSDDFSTPVDFTRVTAKEDQPLHAGKRPLKLQEKRSAHVSKSIFGRSTYSASPVPVDPTPVKWQQPPKNPFKRYAPKKNNLCLRFDSVEAIELDD